ncbi:MAG: hypothetical protein HDS41_06360 [Bacteroides sp.]|nr:hypothetical protein [Bacteroides sp.]
MQLNKKAADYYAADRYGFRDNLESIAITDFGIFISGVLNSVCVEQR